MTTMDRVSQFATQLNPLATPLDKITQKLPDDVVITLALRTPLTKAGRGAMKDTLLDGLTFKILEQVRTRMNMDPSLVEDICLGNVRDGKASYYCRVAALAAGFPSTTAASSSSRFCSSGLTATQHIATSIATGVIDVGIAVGAELLSTPIPRLDREFVEEVLQNQDARDCMIPMGGTSEIVAKEFNVTREEQDRYAVESYRRAETAQKAGWFADEIAPITVKKDGQEVLIEQDEIRWGTTYDKISKLPGSFQEYGDRSTAGNSSQVTDGAAALLLMKRSKALELGQPILGKYAATALAGLPPRIMGIGPSLAIPKLLKKVGLDLKKDVDVVEINEAFASMAVYCRDKLDLNWEVMNPRGGAIALGHPFGMTGVRQIVTGLSECRRTKKKILLTSMCLGTGMGMAGLFVNEQNV
ncbi:probable 3-ketoacyl-CoA thiolase A [Ramularia collo-cygni]|uniref:Probable 3-ketoacyl-CoA thiolase A n=1 Tax=Ramularia collo-cygni TaxID=112498 RepID=A0A2D3UVN8_9PEZI|nr:probable 3-ketoacyl-CoA thiolase A [Ramularia collo-cygni]CZT20771.1 probable 3-ketoacyl-CoA thiolase A [Ramularia collo-cygni]